MELRDHGLVQSKNGFVPRVSGDGQQTKSSSTQAAAELDRAESQCLYSLLQTMLGQVLREAGIAFLIKHEEEYAKRCRECAQMEAKFEPLYAEEHHRQAQAAVDKHYPAVVAYIREHVGDAIEFYDDSGFQPDKLGFAVPSSVVGGLNWQTNLVFYEVLFARLKQEVPELTCRPNDYAPGFTVTWLQTKWQ